MFIHWAGRKPFCCERLFFSCDFAVYWAVALVYCSCVRPNCYEGFEQMNSTQVPEPVQRVLRFAGKKRSEVSNPCLTAREVIVIANWIQANFVTAMQPAEPAKTATIAA